VTVTPEWWSRRAFTEWMRGQEWQGRQLDKDILWPGNKIYAPDKCLFVPQEINNLLTNPQQPVVSTQKASAYRKHKKSLRLTQA
jgi:7,8-dihydro-6-hydroxymethylpterin-pyrophosphokinase